MWPYSPRYGRASWVPVYVALPSPSRRGRFDPSPLHRTHSSPIPVLPCAPAPFFPRRREPIPLRHLSLVPARGDMSLPHKQTTGILAISGRGGSRTALPLFDPHANPVIPAPPPPLFPRRREPIPQSMPAPVGATFVVARLSCVPCHPRGSGSRTAPISSLSPASSRPMLLTRSIPFHPVGVGFKPALHRTHPCGPPPLFPRIACPPRRRGREPIPQSMPAPVGATLVVARLRCAPSPLS